MFLGEGSPPSSELPAPFEMAVLRKSRLPGVYKDEFRDLSRGFPQFLPVGSSKSDHITDLRAVSVQTISSPQDASPIYTHSCAPPTPGPLPPLPAFHPLLLAGVLSVESGVRKLQDVSPHTSFRKFTRWLHRCQRPVPSCCHWGDPGSLTSHCGGFLGCFHFCLFQVEPL